jgi:hypothetical protein
MWYRLQWLRQYRRMLCRQLLHLRLNYWLVLAFLNSKSKKARTGVNQAGD